MRIILAIDNSKHSNYAIRNVAEGYWPEGTTVTVVTAVWAPFGLIAPKETPEAAVKFVEEASSALQATNKFAEVASKTVLGNPKTEIPKLCNESQAGLLVIGSRRPTLSHLFFGSTSHALLLAAPCSVRIAREPKRHRIPRVLVAFDGSEFAIKAMRWLYEGEWPQDTEIILANAVPTVSDSAYDKPDIFSLDQLERGRARLLQVAEKELQQAAEEAQEKLKQCKVSFKVLHGEPREAVVHAADDLDADTVVVGTQGRNFSAQVAIGSVSEAVAVGASCTVQIVKTKPKAIR